MLSWVVTFLVIALIAGILGFGGIAGVDRNRQDHLLYRRRAVPDLGRGRPGARRTASDAAISRASRSFGRCPRARDGAWAFATPDAGADIGRKRRGLARVHVDMNGHVFRSGRQPAFGGVAQFLKGVQPLFVGADQQDRDLHGIAEMNFAQIAHMAFGGEGRAVAFLHVAGARSQAAATISSMARSNITL